MAVEFRCEHCDAMLSADAQAGVEVECPECGQASVVPAGLASLPHPQVPGEESADLGDADSPQPQADPPAETYDDEDGDPEGHGEEEEEEELGEPSPTMEWLAQSVPWLISVFLMATVMLILLFINILVFLPGLQEAVIVPDANMSEDPGSASTTAQSADNQQSTDRPVNRLSEAESSQVSTSRTQSNAVPLFGSGAGGAAGGFGTGGGGGGMRGKFLGSGGNAHHIVFVIDRSGSMRRSFDRLRLEMLKSIGTLDPIQDFHVIFFSEERGTPPPEKQPNRLTPATEQYQIEVANFLDGVRARGGTVAAPAVERAFAVLERADPAKPGKVIRVLSDGVLADWPDPLNTANRLNTDQTVFINTFFYSSDNDAAAEQMLRQLAEENGGRFRHVNPLSY